MILSTSNETPVHNIIIFNYRFSPFLMACYNPGTGEFQSVCRVMSGFSDAFYIEVTSFLFIYFLSDI